MTCLDMTEHPMSIACVLCIIYFVSSVLPSVPEAQLKSIVWQTLQAVNFCHKHNVSILITIANAASTSMGIFAHHILAITKMIVFYLKKCTCYHLLGLLLQQVL